MLEMSKNNINIILVYLQLNKVLCTLILLTIFSTLYLFFYSVINITTNVNKITN